MDPLTQHAATAASIQPGLRLNHPAHSRRYNHPACGRRVLLVHHHRRSRNGGTTWVVTPRSPPSSRSYVCRPQSNPMALGWPSLSRATVHGCRLQLSSAKVLLLGDARFRVYNTSLDSPRPCPLR
ncbi:hypothetical protein VPH35_026888 [Triticum aestivum]